MKRVVIWMFMAEQYEHLMLLFDVSLLDKQLLHVFSNGKKLSVFWESHARASAARFAATPAGSACCRLASCRSSCQRPASAQNIVKAHVYISLKTVPAALPPDHGSSSRCALSHAPTCAESHICAEARRGIKVKQPLHLPFIRNIIEVTEICVSQNNGRQTEINSADRLTVGLAFGRS